MGNDGKKRFCYYDENQVAVLFKTKLLGIESVGSTLKADREENSFKNSQYTGEATTEHWAYDRILQWDVEHRNALEQSELQAESRKRHPAGLEARIKELREHTYTLTAKQRAAFALWVYNQLT